MTRLIVFIFLVSGLGSALARSLGDSSHAGDCEYKGRLGKKGPYQVERLRVLALRDLRAAYRRQSKLHYREMHNCLQNADFKVGENEKCASNLISGGNSAAYVKNGNVYFCIETMAETEAAWNDVGVVVQLLLHEAAHMAGAPGGTREKISGECLADRIAKEVRRNAGKRVFPGGYDSECGVAPSIQTSARRLVCQYKTGLGVVCE